MAVAGGGGGCAGFADGCAADVHALLPQETPLSWPSAACREGPPLAERKQIRHTCRAPCHTGKRQAATIMSFND